MLSRGAQMTSTLPRCFLTISAAAAIYRVPSYIGQRFADMQSVMHTNIGGKEFG